MKYVTNFTLTVTRLNYLNNTWTKHNQARILVYISDELNAKKIDVTDDVDDLPTITLQVGMDREREKYCQLFLQGVDEWGIRTKF